MPTGAGSVRLVPTQGARAITTVKFTERETSRVKPFTSVHVTARVRYLSTWSCPRGAPAYAAVPVRSVNWYTPSTSPLSPTA